MICVKEFAILKKSQQMPLGYLQDCQQVAIINNDQWCFSPPDFFRIRRKYRGYAVSEADTFREGEIISGCCDRADQY
jgi:hypothetical protein